MYGHGVNYNKLRNPPGRKSRVFSCSVPRRYGAFPGVMGRSGVAVGDREQGQGNRGRATETGEQGNRGKGKAIFHALCGNCKENLAKSRLKTEISRYLRKFLLKNLHKAKICRTFAVSKRKKNKMKTIIEQFKNLKEEYPDAVLLFRCGDFYETYMDDATTAANILGITLTRSAKQQEDDGRCLRMAGFPYFLLDEYLPKLIRAGHRIAICDQIGFA